MNLMEWIHPSRTVEAHCDLPCGIYDPEQARIEAESCLKIDEKYADSKDETFRAQMCNRFAHDGAAHPGRGDHFLLGRQP